MNIADAIKRMCSKSGKGPIQVSRELGRSKAYISAAINRGSAPRVDTLAKIANVCGYTVVLEGHGERIELDADLAPGPGVTIEYEDR